MCWQDLNMGSSGAAVEWWSMDFLACLLSSLRWSCLIVAPKQQVSKDQGEAEGPLKNL